VSGEVSVFRVHPPNAAVIADVIAMVNIRIAAKRDPLMKTMLFSTE
jgi:hypothetical protein